MSVRRLTPRECEKLQGFPDDWTLIPGTGPKKQKLEADYVRYLMREVNGHRRTREECFGLAADGPRYRALGNSMAVPVMRYIGQRIRAVEAAYHE
jgi:site-specific DNA-cytosine methylase